MTKMIQTDEYSLPGVGSCFLQQADHQVWNVIDAERYRQIHSIELTAATVTSGIRLGSAACTSRGMGVEEFEEIGDMILTLLGGVKSGAIEARTEKSIRAGMIDLTRRFPLPY